MEKAAYGITKEGFSRLASFKRKAQEDEPSEVPDWESLKGYISNPRNYIDIEVGDSATIFIVRIIHA